MPNTARDHIRVWRFHDAPQELQDACNHNGGDEDWLAVVPSIFGWIGWLESQSFGCCSINRYAISERGEVFWLLESRDDQPPTSEPCGRVKDATLFNTQLYVGCHA